MVSVRWTNETHPLAEGFLGARAALEGVFHYYKSGRHGEALPETPYFLLSRCTHVLFSLWLAEQESEGAYFGATPPPAAFLMDLDFGELRYSEYKRRMLHADSLEDHLTHETKWFEFWMRILERLDPAGTPSYQEFSRRILTCAGRSGFLEGKAAAGNGKALDLFLKSDEAGRVLARTMSVLEDLIRAIVGYFALPDRRLPVLAQITLLVGLLSDIRRIIIWETPAKGPCAPCDPRWRTRSPLAWLFRDRTQGILALVPRREGGEIICTYSPASDSQGHRSSWVRKLTSFKGTYEEELFATWSYDTGEYGENPRQSPDVTACWTVQYTEAGRLETLSRQVDDLLRVLQRSPLCKCLVEAVRRMVRNDSPRWKATALPWTYVRQLDQLLNKLTFVYREAKAVGGDDAPESVIGRIWPSGEMTNGGVGPSGRQGRPDERASHGSASGGAVKQGIAGVSHATDAAQKPEPPLPCPATGSVPKHRMQWISTTPASVDRRLRSEQAGDEKSPVAEPQEKSGSPGEDVRADDAEPADRETPGEPAAVPGDSALRKPQQAPEPQSSAGPMQVTPAEQESRSAEPSAHAQQPPERNSTPGTSDAARSPERLPCAEPVISAEPETKTDDAVVPVAQENPRPDRARATKATNTNPARAADDALLRKLLEHHGCLGGTSNYEPVSAAELQRDLGWNRSKVQRAMTNVFGTKPFRAYEGKCTERTISIFLTAFAGGFRGSDLCTAPTGFPGSALPISQTCTENAV